MSEPLPGLFTFMGLIQSPHSWDFPKLCPYEIQKGQLASLHLFLAQGNP